MLVLAPLATLPGCGCNPIHLTFPPVYHHIPQYVPNSSPEAVISNLAAAFDREDRVEADSLLSGDFIFRFQQFDIQMGAPDSLIRSEILACLQNLFVNGSAGGDPPASMINLVLVIISKDDDNRVGHAGWKRYDVNTALTIFFADGNQTLVNAPARMYFKQEPASSGVWRLSEWDDEPGSTDRPARSLGVGGADRTGARSWGKLFFLYR